MTVTAVRRGFRLTTGNTSAVACLQGACRGSVRLDELLLWARGGAPLTCSKGHVSASADDFAWDGKTVNSGNETYLDDVQVSGATFWHASRVTDWLSTAQSSAITAELNDEAFYVHVGNRRTAETIIAQHHCGAGVGHVPSGMRANKGWTMYELRLRADVRVATKFITDGAFDSRRFRTSSPVRYVNEFEIPGDISLVVDPRHLEVVSKRRAAA